MRGGDSRPSSGVADAGAPASSTAFTDQLAPAAPTARPRVPRGWSATCIISRTVARFFTITGTELRFSLCYRYGIFNYDLAASGVEHDGGRPAAVFEAAGQVRARILVDLHRDVFGLQQRHGRRVPVSGGVDDVAPMAPDGLQIHQDEAVFAFGAREHVSGPLVPTPAPRNRRPRLTARRTGREKAASQPMLRAAMATWIDPRLPSLPVTADEAVTAAILDPVVGDPYDTRSRRTQPASSDPEPVSTAPIPVSVGPNIARSWRYADYSNNARCRRRHPDIDTSAAGGQHQQGQREQQ